MAEISGREAGTSRTVACRVGSGRIARRRKPSRGKSGQHWSPSELSGRCIWGYLGVNFLMFLRFFFPRALYEPNTVFNIGFPSDFGLGIDQRYLMTNRVWVVREPDRLFVIFARCTHLGCTPEWKPAENKFKCPCHGSGYDSEGVNFEGPAPRPMDRANVDARSHGKNYRGYQPALSWTIRAPA